MSTVTTHYTSHDLQPYYATIKAYPRLSDEEIQALVASVSASDMQARTEQALHVRQQLIESHLGIAVHSALAYCPSSLYESHYSDLLQAANLALVEAMDHYDWERKGNLLVYLYAFVKGRIREAFVNSCPIKLSSWARTQARKQGTMEELYRIQPISLDYVLHQDGDEDTLYEALAMPPSTSVAPHDEHEKSAQIDTLLSYLSPRAQAMVRLRYGLFYEDDERPRSESEIATLFGVCPGTVRVMITDALRRLQGLVNGQAKLVKRAGKGGQTEGFCISYPDTERYHARFSHPEITAEQRALLTDAALRVAEQNLPISGERLAQISGVSKRIAYAFLREGQAEEESALVQHKRRRAQQRQQRLERALAQLQTNGERATVEALAKMAHVSGTTASQFLRSSKAHRFAKS